MRARILAHLRGNVVAYVALFAALGGTSYAAASLRPGSVHSAALANRAVTHSKLARNSVTSQNVAPGALTRADFTAAAQTAPGGAQVAARARAAGSVTAPKGASTSVPLTANTWTQNANELDLLAGAMTVQIPASCTGSFGNSLVISVDGTPTTVGIAPSTPASGTVRIPFVVGTLTEPQSSASHTVTAAFANSCTKAGEDFKVSDVKLDVIAVP